jgi:hypothetical protein
LGNWLSELPEDIPKEYFLPLKDLVHIVQAGPHDTKAEEVADS